LGATDSARGDLALQPASPVCTLDPLRVSAAFRPTARRFRVSAAFFSCALRLRVRVAFFAVARRFRVRGRFSFPVARRFPCQGRFLPGRAALSCQGRFLSRSRGAFVLTLPFVLVS
jgi:hypothetical protein